MADAGAGAPAPAAPRRLGSRLLASALVAYAGLLVLAATPAEIRPDLLDRPARAARRGLDVLGLSAGQAVFSSNASHDQVPLAWCIRVQGARPASVRQDLFWPDPDCPLASVRLAISPLHRALHRLLVTARSARTRDPAVAQQLLADLGRYFCHAHAPVADVHAAVWIVARDYATLAVSRESVLYLRYACGADRLALARWELRESELVELWGAIPWQPRA